MKQRFLELLRTINREGMEDLIKFLENSDFLTLAFTSSIFKYPLFAKYINNEVTSLFSTLPLYANANSKLFSSSGG